ncbi:hypothetical protein GCM10027190_04580 [Spirosoma areae]
MFFPQAFFGIDVDALKGFERADVDAVSSQTHVNSFYIRGFSVVAKPSRFYELYEPVSFINIEDLNAMPAIA